MWSVIAKRSLIAVLIVSLSGISVPLRVQAEIIGTQTLIDLKHEDGRLARFDALLAREDVREQLIGMGVDPAEARVRLAALTDAELQILEREIDKLPAGGHEVLVIIGVVFLVLLILELVGVTNIFTKF